MPLPFAWLVAFALGGGFALLAKGEVARSEGPLATSRPMLIVLGFAALVFTPIAGYFVAFHGDWAYLYALTWQSVPSAVDLALVIAAGALVPAGFVAGVFAVRSRRAGGAAAIHALIGLPLGATAILALAFAKRLSVSASAAQYRGGFGVEPLTTSALGKGILWGLVALAAGIAWAVRALRSSD